MRRAAARHGAWTLGSPALLVKRLATTLSCVVLLTGSPVAFAAGSSTAPVQKGDQLWDLLGTTAVQIDSAQGSYVPTYPAPVKALAGRPISITGFIMPLEEANESNHFILTRYTPGCPFCDPANPNQTVEIFAAHPVPMKGSMITLTGRFTLQKTASAGLFFRLDQAQLVS